MPYFNIVAQTNENTVVTEYEPSKARSESYQSEAALEAEFIKLLSGENGQGGLGYEYLKIHQESDLIANLRKRLEILNDYQFSDSEWERFFSESLANQNEGIVEKTRKIQEDNVQVLKRDDGSTKNITIIDKKNIHNNFLQVINQYVIGTADGAKHDNRYDVTILVNGLPLVHVELKRRGVAIREAFNQINRYQRDSFWAGSGLFEYVQLFVISNGTNTKYYSNSTRFNAIKDANASKTKKGKTSNSFEFTSYWADSKNRVIADLVDFTKTFFARHTILNILTKYCIFTSENMLMVMRPYQITATERILNRIEIANNYKKYGDISGGGYIWHTTGSGKTLTSFKTARLASNLPYIDKVLFVVDRKDLDYQTMKEYDRFEKGAANSNTKTSILQRQLEDKDKNGVHHEYKIIITTIQKLATFIKKNKEHMFLTGFDATTLNTLWVDKNLKMHGLIQAFSRTNRILNSIKTFGNIVCFRNLQKRVDSAISLFGDKDAGGIVLMQSFKDYYYGYTGVDDTPHPGYVDMIEELTTKFPVEEARIEGETNQKAFISLFGAILRMRNLLSSFDEFAGKEILSDRDMQDYLGKYQDLRDEWKRKREEHTAVNIDDDIVFEIELIKQIEINIDYILMLVKKYHDSHCEDKEVLVTIKKAIAASPELRSKKALIENFIAGINDVDDIMTEWNNYVAAQRDQQLTVIIEEERLQEDATRRLLEYAFRLGEIKTTGTDIDKILPPVSRFGGGNRSEIKERVISRLMAYFEKFRNIGESFTAQVDLITDIDTEGGDSD